MAKKIVKEVSKYRFIISKFIINPKSFKPADWAREMNIAKRLLVAYPDFDFWKSVNFNFKLNSLAWLVNGDGKLTLKLHQQKRLLDLENKPNEVVLEKENIGESVELKAKPKTLMEFLKYGKK